MHMIRTTLIAAMLATLGVSTPAFAHGKNEPMHHHQTVALSDLPQAARDAIKKETSGETIKKVYKEMENGKTVYEAEYAKKGKLEEVRVAEDGTVLGHEMLKKHSESKEHEKK